MKTQQIPTNPADSTKIPSVWRCLPIDLFLAQFGPLPGTGYVIVYCLLSGPAHSSSGVFAEVVGAGPSHDRGPAGAGVRRRLPHAAHPRRWRQRERWFGCVAVGGRHRFGGAGGGHKCVFFLLFCVCFFGCLFVFLGVFLLRIF